MKVRNLSEYPMPLGDGRMIGVGREREYRAEKLADEDKLRIKNGTLEVVAEEIPPVETAKPTINGGKNNNAK